MQEFAGESDRAAAVLGASYLDSLLQDVFVATLVADADPGLYTHRGPLGDFAAKIDLAHSLGWIPDEARKDLHIIRGIRNEFAHLADDRLSFEDDSIRDRTSNLHGRFWLDAELPHLFKGGQASIDRARKLLDARKLAPSRKRFEFAVINSFNFLEDLLDEVQEKNGKLRVVP